MAGERAKHEQVRQSGRRSRRPSAFFEAAYRERGFPFLERALVAQLVLGAVGAERGNTAQAVGVPYGADMRLFCARGIPCVMAGTPGLELAHAVDESVSVDDLVALARVLVRVVARFGG